MIGKLARSVIAAALLWVASALAAHAQSGCSIFVYGKVPTPAQWNQCVGTKQDLLGYIPLNTTGGAMTGRLVTTPSTTSRSGFSIGPGVAPTTPVDGDVWVTTAGVFAQVNGSTIGPFASAASIPSVIQGDMLYATGVGVLAALHKNTTATRYLANTGTSNAPNWDQVNLANGVTGALPLANIATGTLNTSLGYWGSTIASAIAVPNCTTAITFNTTTHAWGCNGSTGSGTVTSVAGGYGVTGGPITTSGTLAVGLSTLTNSLSTPVALTNTSTYFDGPSVAQGTSGTWYATGTVTLNDTATINAGFSCKLWDGTTLISSTGGLTAAAGTILSLSLSGFITSPAANIRISCRDTSSTSGQIGSAQNSIANASTLNVFRIQ